LHCTKSFNEILSHTLSKLLDSELIINQEIVEEFY